MIGANSNSNNKLCKDFKLDWTQGPAKILRVTFTTNFYDIWDFNSIEILNKVKAMLKQWSKRKLTLFGRITIIKSLALSKFCIAVSVITESSCGAYQRTRGFYFQILIECRPR